MNITIVAGARPNFMKIAPIIKAIRKANEQHASTMHYRLVHTGQHFDRKMSGAFFEQLGIPDPNVNLECGGGTQAEQTAAILVKFERELQEHRPEVVLVVGDVTSTMACTLAARKLGVEVAHVEAGIRSGDWSMPEEINRVVTDAVCNHFFTTTEQASLNLLRNAVPQKNVHLVGNTMIDTLYQNLGNLKKPAFWDAEKVTPGHYFVATLHRPSNVDDPKKLAGILDAITDSTGAYNVVFPVHPRTRKVLESLRFRHDKFILIDPQGYLEFIYLVKHALGVITDSGGITEEATVLGVPCLTLRTTTERPETVSMGTNELIGEDFSKLAHCLGKIIKGQWKKGSIPPLWDGKTSERIVQILHKTYAGETLPVFS